MDLSSIRARKYFNCQYELVARSSGAVCGCQKCFSFKLMPMPRHEYRNYNKIRDEINRQILEAFWAPPEILA